MSDVPWIPSTMPSYRNIPGGMAKRWLDGGSGGLGSQWWDGAAAHEAELLGWWTGSSAHPVEVLGWWDGAAVQELEGV